LTRFIAYVISFQILLKLIKIRYRMKLIVLIAIILALLHAEVIPFDNSAIEKIFQQKKSALFLFLGDENA
jgi:hypothetical protein